MQILARYSDTGRYSKVEAQAHYHQEGITMRITWYMAKFAGETRYQEIEVEYYDFNWKNSARNCQDGRYRSVSMKLIICPERLYNMEIDVLWNYVRFWTENMVSVRTGRCKAAV